VLLEFGSRLTKIIVGALVLLIALVVIMRRVFRKRRLGKAEYPPTSPLLPPMEDSFLPPSIARSISQRSKASSNNNGVGHNRMDSSSSQRSNLQPLDFQNEKAGFDREYRGILSPLPPAARGAGQGAMFPQGQTPQRRVEPERDMSGRLKEFGLP
jgi:hypothetical protein